MGANKAILKLLGDRMQAYNDLRDFFPQINAATKIKYTQSDEVHQVIEVPLYPVSHDESPVRIAAKMLQLRAVKYSDPWVTLRITCAYDPKNDTLWVRQKVITQL
ncbi:MAG: hypothetical protein Kow00120_00510 [Anaerolineae bacterium]